MYFTPFTISSLIYKLTNSERNNMHHDRFLSIFLKVLHNSNYFNGFCLFLQNKLNIA